MIYIVGIVGVGYGYGGFETLVENLIESRQFVGKNVVVYCEQEVVEKRGTIYNGVRLIGLPIRANGWQSVLYDSYAILLSAIRGGQILVLGTSGTFIVPVIRILFPRSRVIVNMAGLEWARSKWGLVARGLLKLNEWAAVRFAHEVIADNEGLVDYVKETYGVDAVFIPYGGDQYLPIKENSDVLVEFSLPSGQFDFAIGRAQTDNNVQLILETYAGRSENLVFVSNWDSSKFGRSMKRRYGHFSNLFLVGPIYDLGKIKALRARARLYIHGHSAGGTNPALVEAMWACLPVFAYDVSYNRHTTNNLAHYFDSVESLSHLLDRFDANWATECSVNLSRTARRKYAWKNVVAMYSDLF
jgi:glycosyltransferase involved in cell wall biosynthesis